ncbi:MAG: N-acetylmuramic acid 6-phosphate etherase, partial [Mucilaginibacter sp.]|nr:N-acetylmuramic acid 6-phosphate etherase [Mucilaginibacter sp.]
MAEYNITDKDVVVGFAASGTTPYVIGGLKAANENNI